MAQSKGVSFKAVADLTVGKAVAPRKDYSEIEIAPEYFEALRANKGMWIELGTVSFSPARGLNAKHNADGFAFQSSPVDKANPGGDRVLEGTYSPDYAEQLIASRKNGSK